jgi:2'-5' RNA ligase
MGSRGGSRLFIAADPPGELRERLSAWARAQRGGAHGIRLVPAANVHLTLAFLGERDRDEIDAVVRAMSSAAQSGGVHGLSIGEPLLLPPRRPRVLAAAVADPAGRLAALRDELSSELRAEIGWSEARAFRPHLTLARLARDARLPRELAPLPAGDFDVEELVLFRSHLEPSGARYEAIARVALN